MSIDRVLPLTGNKPQKKPCIVCGRSYTQYQERMTPERVAGSPRPNRMLCRVCYESAGVRATIEVRAIPGVPKARLKYP